MSGCRLAKSKNSSVIIKGDVQGSVEALAESLARLSTEEVKLDMIHASAGAISETDVTLASASKAIIIGFNMRPEPKAAHARRKGRRRDSPLHDYLRGDQRHSRGDGRTACADLSREIAGPRRSPQDFHRARRHCRRIRWWSTARLLRNARARLVRDGRVVWEGKIGTLRRFKDDAREVCAGYECGIGLENFNDMKPDDVIEAFEMEADSAQARCAQARAGCAGSAPSKNSPQP